MASSDARLSGEVRSAQVRRILESRAFRNTEVLKRLLDYLARQAGDPRAADLKEYTVGVEAFGKPPEYDPKTDSSVRVQAGKLRQKLDEYYRTEGAGDDCIVELPKGHFELQFRQREEAAPPVHGKPRGLLLILGAAGLLAVAAIAILLWARPATGPLPPLDSAMEELWRPFLKGPRPVLVVLGTPLFTKIGNNFYRMPTLNTWEAVKESGEMEAVRQAAGGAMSPYSGYTGVGEAAGAFAIQRLLIPRVPDLTLQMSSLLTWEDIARHNTIFLGPPKYIQQTLQLPVQLDFEISHARVQNLRPLAGEPGTFEEKWAAGRTVLEEGHALISRVAGLHGAGELLILAGSSTEGTRAAAEFVTRVEYVAPFVRSLRRRGGFPAHFQAVIRARFRSGTPVAIEQVAFHPLP